MHTFKGNLSTKHGAPPGSKVIPNPNAYMTDKVWNDMAPAFAKILWDVPVVKKYPDLWMAITLDYSGYYLEGDALDVFADHNILIVKEEVDTSKVCQANDNEIDKINKCRHRDFLNTIQCDMPCIDLWTLIFFFNKVCSLFASCIISCFIKQMTNLAPRLP